MEHKKTKGDYITGEKEYKNSTGRTGQSDTNYRGSAITGMIKSFSGITKYGGSFQEDLYDTVEAFETVAELCEIETDAEKKKAIPIMLKESAFRPYSSNKHIIKVYDEWIATVKGWYYSK